MPDAKLRHSALALVIALALLVAPSLAQAQQSTSFPLTITDDVGVASTFKSSPQRIVSLNPGLTEIAFALGAGPRLVAVDTYSNFPPEARSVQPRLPTYPSPSVETIVSLQPDVVLALAEKDDVLDQIRRQGIPVMKLLPRDFESGVKTIRTLGQLLGAPGASETLATNMLTRRDAVVAAVADAPRPRVFEELDASDAARPYAAGPNGFYGQLIDLAGGTNIFADLPGDFGQVSAESIIERDPEIILLTDADLPQSPQTPAMVAARPGWDVIAAVQNDAIYVVSGELYTTFGPRLIDGLEALAQQLHPDLFP
jgi:iron complex transport system substrate-binding protein